MKMVNSYTIKIEKIIKNKLCCGCGVCENICPKSAINMMENDEGFLYPQINHDLCVSCKKCEKHCPILCVEKVKLGEHEIHAYAVSLSDEDKLKKTASGGVSTALAEYMIQNNGIVYGVSYDDYYFSARHIRVAEASSIEKIMQTKYIQSVKANIYHLVQKDLWDDKKVLYTGTPCEVAALKTYLDKDYENLYTCELICHGPTNGKAQEMYINYLEEKESAKVKKFLVRSKCNGWKTPTFEVELDNGKTIVEEFYRSEMGIIFSNFTRESCYNCQYKGNNKVADITVGDFWGITEESEFWKEYGVSAVMAHSLKGEKLLHCISGVDIHECKYQEILDNNPMLERSRFRPHIRSKFGKHISVYGIGYAIGHIDSGMCKLKKLVKRIVRGVE